MTTKTKKSSPKRKIAAAVAAWPVRSILVPTDFSEHANHALLYAIQLARKIDAKITVLHVIERPVIYPDAGLYYPEPDSFEQTARSAEKTIQRLCRENKLRRPILGKVLTEVGTPFQTIVDTANSQAADLIIVSTHGRTGITRVLMGSTAERVVRHAPCPVLVVRNPVRPAGS